MQIADLNHIYGNDITPTAGGDLLTVFGGDRTRQRILRRLMTSPGAYIFHPEYGAGVGERVGDLYDQAALSALIGGQAQLEEAVAQTPAPVVSVRKITGGAMVTIAYTDSATGQPDGLSFNATQ